MRAELFCPLACLAAGLMAGVTSPASAQAESPWAVDLTEAPEPDSKAWEDPARIALTIDPDGADQFSAQLNLEVARDITRRSGANPFQRSKTLGGYLRWNRETGGDKQNNFEVGANFKLGHDFIRRTYFSDEQLQQLSNEQISRIIEREAKQLDFSLDLSSGYARTAHFADPTSATCVATPSAAQCDTQFSESLRSSATLGILTPYFEGKAGRGLFYSLEPKLGLDHDVLLNSPIDVDTGLRVKGGYLSGVAGLAVVLTPGFINPGWELKASGQVRQEIVTSTSRKPSIESTAEQFELSATYYFFRPRNVIKGGWRAGVGVVYSHGNDPLTGQPDGDKIVIAFKLGQY